jgi:hypothetical protein
MAELDTVDTTSRRIGSVDRKKGGRTRQNKNEQLIKTYYLSTSEKHQRGISSAFRFSVGLWLALGLGHSREMSRTSRLRQTKP